MNSLKRPRSLFAILVAFSAILALPAELRAQGPTLEPLEADYKDVRGVNYIPSWAGTSAAIWGSDWCETTLDNELSHIKHIGLNAIRIWLNYWAYYHDPSAFIYKFTRLMDLSANHGIYVMPILFDAVGASPSSTTPWSDSQGWRCNPGVVNDATNALHPTYWPYYDLYVDAVVAVGDPRANLLMWDIMNEPAVLAPQNSVDAHIAFCQYYSMRLRSYLSVTKDVTIGYALPYNNGIAHSSTPTDPMINYVDVASFHHYYMFRENLDGKVTEMEAFGKPFLCTEIGWPARAQSYEDQMRYCFDEQMGFFLFQAMNARGGPLPEWSTTGVLFMDGSVRSDEVLDTLADIASYYGVQVGTPRPTVRWFDFGDPNYASDPYWYWFLPVAVEGFGAPDLLEMVYNTSDPLVGYPSTKNPYVDGYRWSTYHEALWNAAIGLEDLGAISANERDQLALHSLAFKYYSGELAYDSAHQELLAWIQDTRAFLLRDSIGDNP